MQRMLMTRSEGPAAYLFFIRNFYDPTSTVQHELAIALSDHVGSEQDAAYPLGPVFSHCHLGGAGLLLRIKDIRATVIGDQLELEGLIGAMRPKIVPGRSFAYLADNFWCERQEMLSARLAREFRVRTYFSVPNASL